MLCQQLYYYYVPHRCYLSDVSLRQQFSEYLCITFEVIPGEETKLRMWKNYTDKGPLSVLLGPLYERK